MKTFHEKLLTSYGFLSIDDRVFSCAAAEQIGRDSARDEFVAAGADAIDDVPDQATFFRIVVHPAWAADEIDDQVHATWRDVDLSSDPRLINFQYGWFEQIKSEKAAITPAAVEETTSELLDNNFFLLNPTDEQLSAMRRTVAFRIDDAKAVIDTFGIDLHYAIVDDLDATIELVAKLDYGNGRPTSQQLSELVDAIELLKYEHRRGELVGVSAS